MTKSSVSITINFVIENMCTSYKIKSEEECEIH
jgi:hypothetical protein